MDHGPALRRHRHPRRLRRPGRAPARARAGHARWLAPNGWPTTPGRRLRCTPIDMPWRRACACGTASAVSGGVTHQAGQVTQRRPTAVDVGVCATRCACPWCSHDCPRAGPALLAPTSRGAGGGHRGRAHRRRASAAVLVITTRLVLAQSRSRAAAELEAAALAFHAQMDLRATAAQLSSRPRHRAAGVPRPPHRSAARDRPLLDRRDGRRLPGRPRSGVRDRDRSAAAPGSPARAGWDRRRRPPRCWTERSTKPGPDVRRRLSCRLRPPSCCWSARRRCSPTRCWARCRSATH